MDVISPGQTPKGPTAHIALPRPGAAGFEDSITDSLIRGERDRASLTGTDSGLGLNSNAPPRGESPKP